VSRSFVPGVGTNVRAIEAALKAQDVEALYKIDPEFAPFLCHRCHKSYCKSCWTVWVEFDEVFYDCTRGRCPKGHERVMDD
jgi:hypothetical protein